MKILSLFLSCVVCSESWAACIDKKTERKMMAAVDRKVESILDPKNRTAVPPGLPEGEYPVRSSNVISTIQGSALVFILFRSTQQDEGFMAPYSFDKKDDSLVPISVPADLGNSDSRFWRAKASVKERCDRPSVGVTYDACLACGAWAA
jgi:hypothetical protein